MTAGVKVKLSALMSERLVLYRRPDGVGIFDVLMGALRAAGFAPHVAEEVPRIITAINLVAAGRDTLTTEPFQPWSADGWEWSGQLEPRSNPKVCR